LLIDCIKNGLQEMKKSSIHITPNAMSLQFEVLIVNINVQFNVILEREEMTLVEFLQRNVTILEQQLVKMTDTVQKLMVFSPNIIKGKRRLILVTHLVSQVDRIGLHQFALKYDKNYVKYVAEKNDQNIHITNVYQSNNEVAIILGYLSSLGEYLVKMHLNPNPHNHNGLFPMYSGNNHDPVQSCCMELEQQQTRKEVLFYEIQNITSSDWTSNLEESNYVIDSSGSGFHIYAMPIKPIVEK
jgi:hypothetical protein